MGAGDQEAEAGRSRSEDQDWRRGPVAADGVAREVTREALKASNGTLGRVLADAKTEGRQVYRDLAARGVRLVPGAYGSGPRRSGRIPARLVPA